MARYAYAPLSVDEGGSSSSNNNHNRKSDDKVSERMFAFIGLCILIAITFVLSRSDGSASSPRAAVDGGNDGSPASASVDTGVKRVPVDAAASSASSSGYVVPVGGSPVDTHDAAGPVIQIVPSE